jgi:hypothetical protein
MAKTKAFLSVFLITVLCLTFYSAMSVYADPSWNTQSVDPNCDYTASMLLTSVKDLTD